MRGEVSAAARASLRPLSWDSGSLGSRLWFRGHPLFSDLAFASCFLQPGTETLHRCLYLPQLVSSFKMSVIVPTLQVISFFPHLLICFPFYFILFFINLTPDGNV